jgi:hypothetical protein
MMHHQCPNFQPENEMQGRVSLLTTVKLIRYALLCHAMLYYTEQSAYYAILHCTVGDRASK